MSTHRWEEIQARFHELADASAGTRAKRLARLASADPDLYAALEALLAADAMVTARLGSLEKALLPRRVPTADPLGLSGRVVSHFRVGASVGAGGMGFVYRAEDMRLGRDVALKFLSPAFSLDGSAKARFLREARSAAALDHVNLCAVHEVGVGDGWLFLAMPLYTGETLAARLVRERRLSVTAALAIARQIAAGLQAAHAAGIVHRDLKPANVMLLGDGTVKILDFGLAKARHQTLSDTGGRFGTIAYMAPEQVRGERVDGRTDLWALGVVLYEMLAGRRPFDGVAEAVVVRAILETQPAPISWHRRDVPRDVRDLVLRLLREDRDRRPESAAEVLTALTVPRRAWNRPLVWLRAQWDRVDRWLDD